MKIFRSILTFFCLVMFSSFIYAANLQNTPNISCPATTIFNCQSSWGPTSSCDSSNPNGPKTLTMVFYTVTNLDAGQLQDGVCVYEKADAYYGVSTSSAALKSLK